MRVPVLRSLVCSAANFCSPLFRPEVFATAAENEHRQRTAANGRKVCIADIERAKMLHN